MVAETNWLQTPDWELSTHEKSKSFGSMWMYTLQHFTGYGETVTLIFAQLFTCLVGLLLLPDVIINRWLENLFISVFVMRNWSIHSSENICECLQVKCRKDKIVLRMMYAPRIHSNRWFDHVLKSIECIHSITIRIPSEMNKEYSIINYYIMEE